MTRIPYKSSIPDRLSDGFARGFKSMSIKRAAPNLVEAVERSEYIRIRKVTFMATRSTSDTYASFERVSKSVAAFTKLYGLSYSLRKYVDRNFWVSELRRCFQVTNVDNLTDFNYSRCFSYGINENDLELHVGGEELKKYVVEHGVLDKAQVMVSLLEPYAVCKCLRYEYREGQIVLRSSTESEEWKKSVEVGISDFCAGNNLLLVSDDDLKRKVDGISLELHGPNPTVFNVLFEDGASGFPY